MKRTLLIAALMGCIGCSAPQMEGKVHVEEGGFVLIEAEEYAAQSKDELRKWMLIDSNSDLAPYDCTYHEGASAGVYMKILPDTRRTHRDQMVKEENFTDIAGHLAVLSYNVKFTTPGRYYVWVSCFSSNSEDNGVHVGINGTWAESGQRMQWCNGKGTWYWASKQRVGYNHCGVPGLIWIDVPYAGVHTVEFSMREDGFAMDRFALTKSWNLSKYKKLVGDVHIEEGTPVELLK